MTEYTMVGQLASQLNVAVNDRQSCIMFACAPACTLCLVKHTPYASVNDTLHCHAPCPHFVQLQGRLLNSWKSPHSAPALHVKQACARIIADDMNYPMEGDLKKDTSYERMSDM